MARERLLVMNNCRILQTEKGSGNNAWENTKVLPDAGLKPGFYNLYSAQRPEPNGQYQGAVVHADKGKVIQQSGKQFVSHDASAFKSPPVIGKPYTVAYSSGAATVTEGMSQTQARSRGL